MGGGLIEWPGLIQSYDMTMFPSFFQNPTQKAEQENSQRIQHIQQVGKEYLQAR